MKHCMYNTTTLVQCHAVSISTAKLHIIILFIDIYIQAGIAVNAITDHYSFGWRLSLSIQILIGTVLALGGLFIPETPR